MADPANKDTKYVDLSKWRGLSVKSFRVRVTNGEDTLEAASRCVPLDGTMIDGNLFGIQMRQHQLANAVVEVDGRKIDGPCLESLKWNSRTRDLLGETYDYLNSITQKQRDDFRAMLEEGDVPSASTDTTSSVG